MINPVIINAKTRRLEFSIVHHSSLECHIIDHLLEPKVPEFNSKHLSQHATESLDQVKSIASSWMENPTDKDRLLLKHQMRIPRFRCEDKNFDFMGVQPH